LKKREGRSTINFTGIDAGLAQILPNRAFFLPQNSIMQIKLHVWGNKCGANQEGYRITYEIGWWDATVDKLWQDLVSNVCFV
jgi:hypothetical protein